MYWTGKQKSDMILPSTEKKEAAAVKRESKKELLAARLSRNRMREGKNSFTC